jgi:hypothetical protein
MRRRPCLPKLRTKSPVHPGTFVMCSRLSRLDYGCKDMRFCPFLPLFSLFFPSSSLKPSRMSSVALQSLPRGAPPSLPTRATTPEPHNPCNRLFSPFCVSFLSSNSCSSPAADEARLRHALSWSVAVRYDVSPSSSEFARRAPLLVCRFLSRLSPFKAAFPCSRSLSAFSRTAKDDKTMRKSVRV